MPPLLRRSNGEIQAVAESEIRLPIGVDDDVVYVEHVQPLAAGDCLTLYTDGITEAMNVRNELYGEARLWTQLRTATDGVGGIGQSILEDVKRFIGTRAQSDDMCLACMGRAAGG